MHFILFLHILSEVYMSTHLRTLTAVFLVLILISCTKQDKIINPGSDPYGSFKKGNIPVITNLSPTSAEIGDVLTITGTNFGTKRGSGFWVTIKGVIATVYQSWSQTQIRVIVPSGSASGAGKVSVNVGTQTSNEMNFTLLPSSPVTIGAQSWMGANLDVAFYRNGDPIPQVTDSTAWANLTTGAWCYYNNDPAMGAVFGKLYNWYAVNDSRGLAPVGWHIPTDAEWKTLSMSLGMSQTDADKFGSPDYYFGTDEGGKMKEAGTSLWAGLNVGATNSSGFTALPAGMRAYFSTFCYIGNNSGHMYGTFCAWWSSTPYIYNNAAFVRGLGHGVSTTYRSGLHTRTGLSVRCIQDN
jgi:uncharacterized protein (TIGR02145 family)